MNFIFKTTATMKDYNREKWWIDSEIIRPIGINAKNLKQALKEYQRTVHEEYYVDISENALKNKLNMYTDTKDGKVKQVGYVITGSMDFYRDDGLSSKQFIDLWVTIITVIDTNFSNKEEE